MPTEFKDATGALKRKLGAVIELSDDEVGRLDALESKVKRIPAGAEIVLDGEPYEQTYIVEKGWAIRFKTLSDGRRQILNFVLPGDFIGLFSALFDVADHSVAALTDLTVHPIPPTSLVTLFGGCPRLGAAVAWATARDEAIMSEQVLRVGRRSAYERTGHIFVELLHRLQLVGQAEDDSFKLPLTQEILADTLGLSVVHINRTLRRLRENGLVRINRDRVFIEDLERLTSMAEFSPHYLAAEPLPRDTAAALLAS